MTNLLYLSDWETFLANWKRLPEPFMLSLPEVETITRLTSPFIRNAIDCGRLPAYGFADGVYRITKVSLEAYLASCEIQPTKIQSLPPHRGIVQPFNYTSRDQLLDA